jgi:hypothetical protein
VSLPILSLFLVDLLSVRTAPLAARLSDRLGVLLHPGAETLPTCFTSLGFASAILFLELAATSIAFAAPLVAFFARQRAPAELIGSHLLELQILQICLLPLQD